MAKKNNYKKKNSVTNSSVKKATEVKDWYSKNSADINLAMFKEANESVMKILDPGTGTSKKATIYDANKLEQMMKNPYRNVKDLRGLSRFLFNRVQVYRRLIYFNANMINLDYRSVIPRIDFNKKSNNKKILKTYYETLGCLDHMNLDLAFQPAVINVFREDVFFGCSYLDDEDFFILPLDPDYCQITGVFGDGSLAFSMDMTYFDKHKDLLEYWGDPFQSLYSAYGGKTTNKWQLMPDANSVCIKFDLSDLENPIPPFLGMFDSLINLEDLKTNMGIIDEQDIYKLLVAEIPTNKNGQIDDFTVDPGTAVKYFNKMVETLPDYIGAVLSPIPIKDIHFNSDRAGEVNKVQKATQTVFNSAGGAQVLNSSSITGSTAWNGAIASDEDMAMSSVLPQIEAIINRILKFHIKDASKVKLIPISTYSVDKFRDSVIKSCTYGVPNKLLLGTLNGFNELDTLSMAYLENDLLDLPSKFIPLQSSNTQNTGDIGNKEGRPTNKEKGEPITDDGEASQDKKDHSR